MEGPLRLLLVDDDEDECLIVGDLLQEACTDKFTLAWASTYEQGLAEILSGNYDVCLLDYRLGNKSGLDLLAAVKAHDQAAPASCPQLLPQIILMTGVNDRGVDITATQAGAADFLIKGEFTSALLERSIRYALERGRALKALREASELDSMNRVKSTFLAAMSHETRTPMNVIMGMADMLWDSPLNQEQSGYVELLRRAGSDLLFLINDILDLSNMESNRLEVKQVEFDLEHLIDQVVELAAVKARGKGLLLMFRLAPSVTTTVTGDPGKLRQVLTSLVGNAIKFTESGEILLSVSHAGPERSGELEFKVADTGIGIPPGKLSSIFGDFTQADSSATRKYGGVGLGLGISRRLVEAMGGVLSAVSSEGQGSTFRFSVRLAAESPSAETSKAPLSLAVSMAALANKKILLLDDNATSNLLLKESLSSWGLECVSFAHKEVALENLSSAGAEYSLAILSTGCVPQIDCFGTGMEIRRLVRGLPVLVLTSGAKSRDTNRHVAKGSFGFAVKPVSRSQLLRLVCDVMQEVDDPAANSRPGGKGVRRPARILVVDDSPDNRELVQVYLMSSPYQLTFEEDGKAAVERFVAGEFDLVLMDVQMPVMDGLEATRTIRSLEIELGKSPVPIIVVSANSSLQDMEASSQAGCNVHLAKPLSKVDLIKVIEEYERPLPASEADRSIPVKPIHIDVPRGLEEIVPAYLVRRRKEVFEMRDLMANSNFTRLATLAHNLKGSGTGYGFPDLTRLGAQLNLSATQGDRDALEVQINELSNYLDRVELESFTAPILPA